MYIEDRKALNEFQSCELRYKTIMTNYYNIYILLLYYIIYCKY